MPTEGEARQFYEYVRENLYPIYAEYHRQLDCISDYKLEQTPVAR